MHELIMYCISIEILLRMIHKLFLNIRKNSILQLKLKKCKLKI